MEPGCEECTALKERKHHEEYTIILHTSSQLICGPTKRVKNNKEWKAGGKFELKKSRDIFVRKLKERISALRNSGGGLVFVHISDLNPSDRCLDLFHELVDDRLNDMIEDGSLFVTVYKKDWLSEEGDNKGIVAVTVAPSVGVVTLDYKTKIPLDSSIVDPSSATILKLLTIGFKFTNQPPTIRGLQYAKLRESRHVQVKALFFNNASINTIDTFVDYIWEGLRLREYVTSFSKIDGGGSVFIGIQEEEKQYETYSTKHLIKTGFKLDFSKSVIIDRLKAKVHEETTVLVKESGNVRFTKAENLIDVAFHPLRDKQDFFVLEVAVAAIAGLVFYDANGPEAYEVDEALHQNIRRISHEDWYRRQFNQFKKRSIGVQTMGRN